MFKFSGVSQIWKKYIQKLNDWDLPLNSYKLRHSLPFSSTVEKGGLIFNVPRYNEVLYLSWFKS